MIWEHSGVFNAKENFRLTPQAHRLQNPAAFFPLCTIDSGKEFFSAPNIHDSILESWGLHWPLRCWSDCHAGQMGPFGFPVALSKGDL